MKKKNRNIIGAGIIEFALVLPILVVVLFTIIEYSIIIYDKSVIADASRKGTRYGTMQTSTSYPTTAAVITYTTNYCSGKLITFGSPTAVNVTATSSVSPPIFGATLTVTVQWTYTDLVIHNLLNIGQTHNLTSTTIAPYN